ncbi:ankyrin repeat-containing protein [Tanacetum coccineum]
MTGNWRTADSIIKKHPEVVRYSITKNNETALHVATLAKNTHFVKNLLKHMEKEDMELQNKNYNTTLSPAAAAGAITIAKVMVEKNTLSNQSLRFPFGSFLLKSKSLFSSRAWDLLLHGFIHLTSVTALLEVV